MPVPEKLGRFGLLSVSVVALPGIFNPFPVHAQDQAVLEEVIVTAQRREQSMQEVPVSIEAFSGAQIQRQGFRDLVEMANFSPAARMEINQDRINITVRGIGTAGNNHALEQSVPTFVDGIHFGRAGQVLGAFLDVERVEVLRGPQPVYFGQNANAGAFSITSRKPTADWQGNLRAEVGNYGKQAVEFGVGGPITDTLGIRVAGKYDYSVGYLRDILTTKTFPEYDIFTGRAILQWTPTDNFAATAKFQFATKKTDGDGEAIQRGVGSDMNPVPSDRYGSQSFINGIPNANLQPIPTSFGDGWGIVPGSTFLNPTFSGVPFNPESDRASIDLSGFLPEYIRNNPDAYGTAGPDTVAAHDDLDPWDAYLNLVYTFDNGIELSSLTGFSHYVRENAEDNSGGYYLANWTFRSEYLDQWSQELRLTSPTGGWFEWMAGIYFHKNDLDLRTVGFRANVRRPARNPIGSEDAEWKSAFATVTFNFLDDKASLDLGARYTEVDKHGRQIQYSQQWIFDDGTAEGLVIPNISHTAMSNHPIYSQYLGATPIGLTPEVNSDDDGAAANDATFRSYRLDPQVVLRYRPLENLSLYAKYAEAFKSGGFEIELKSTPPPEDFVFGNEYTTTHEVGARSTFWNGRGQGGITAFYTEVDDLQVGTDTPLALIEETGVDSVTVNAARQRVKGIEFDANVLVTDQLTVGLSGALYDGVMTNFKNAGCTEAEVQTNQCDDMEEFTKDRSGEEAPRLPDWVFVLNTNYSRPFMDRYKISINGLLKYSDGWLPDIETFSRVVQMPEHTDLNLTLGFGDQDDTWQFALYGRNILEPRKKYYPEFDVDPGAFVNTALGSSAFRTYGLQFTYFYN